MKNLNLILFLLIGFLSFSQNKFNISGYVEDVKTGEKLYGVNVYTNSKSGNITNEYGFYSITLPKGSYTLSISYVGYQTIKETINLTQDTRRNF